MQLSEVTVVVPTRNEARNIGAFLRSLPPAVKLIVVDASDDDTPAIIQAVRPQHTHVIRDRSNVTHARQIGAEAATTPWLVFTDADVTFSATYFARLLAQRELDAMYGPKLSVDAHHRYYQWFARAQQLSDRLGMPAASGSNLVISHHAFDAVGGFDLRLTVNEDSEIAWRIKRQGFRIRYTPELVVFARDHRRLKRGTLSKTLHSIARCTLLYLNLMPDRWRSHDWGYWTDRDKAESAAKGS
jgi:glycosyltransferase involved in cell wall biosynthesis